ncbi:MAG TPA: nuclear transport factor 2 family protein [Acetobacteraceae bacterium]|jgi:hypothetical protein|nr:nuclear transport factor 2 family protein [Acetobacteraceae bacterium]
MTASNLPTAVAAYIAATNAFDIEAFMSTFADGALVNDHRNEFVGLAAIRDWAQREIIGDRVTMKPAEATNRGNGVAVTARIDGNFDKTGLPDPILLAFYFTVDNGRIVQLIIVHNKPSA